MGASTDWHRKEISLSRHEFTIQQKRAMRARSGDLCEAGKFGTFNLYGMADADYCIRPAQEFDHVIPTAISRAKIQDIEEGLHVCKLHHKIKTAQDRKDIARAKSLDEKQAGVVKNKKPWPKRGEWKDNTKYINQDMRDLDT